MTLACGAAGGVKYVLDGVGTDVCNGEDGEPWTAGGTLPVGSTLTGAFRIDAAGTGAVSGEGLDSRSDSLRPGLPGRPRLVGSESVPRPRHRRR